MAQVESEPKIAHLFPRVVCTKCGQTKPSSEFRTDRSKPLGRNTQCKECTKERDQKIHAINLSHRAEAIALGHRKNCRVCGELKFVAEFPAGPSCKGGSAHECVECFSIRHLKWRRDNAAHVRNRARQTMRNLRSRHDKDKQAAIARKSRLKTKYGMSPEDVNLMRSAQSNKCLICTEEFSKTAWGRRAAIIDHDHVTKKVRGILCSNCNRGLGMFSDNPEIMQAAISYLKKSRE